VNLPTIARNCLLAAETDAEARAEQLTTQRSILKDPILNMLLWLLKIDTNTRKRKFGQKIIGSGVESVVFQSISGEGVCKVVKKSMFSNPETRKQILGSKLADFETTQTYLSPYLLPQKITDRPHPIYPKLPCVVIEQDFFDGAGITIPTDTMGSFCVSLPFAIRPDLKDLAYRGLVMYSNTGLLPDTCGTNNVHYGNGRLVLVDSQPISAIHPCTQYHIINQLNALTELTDR
jgi:hypothetical protein